MSHCSIDAEPLVSYVTQNSPVAGLEGVAIKAIAAGENHALAVTADGGSVWGWGCGSSGQLGVGRHRRRGGTDQVEAADDREVCTCRYDWSCFDRIVCVLLRVHPHLLYIPQPSKQTHRPLSLDLSALGGDSPAATEVEQVAVGKRHSLLLTRDGRVWSFGSGLYHACGQGRTENEWRPRLVEALEGLWGMRAGR